MSDNYVISEADRNVCLGSGEIKNCPFCGHHAISVGWKNEQSGNTVYQVICTSLHECGATVSCCAIDPEVARRTVIENWNKRA